jgi:subtilisin family serine protease
MAISLGSPEVIIALIDGPVALDHPGLKEAKIRALPTTIPAACSQPASVACSHGTFLAGILCALRDSSAPAICPGCTLLVRPIFSETTKGNQSLPSATPSELATAINDCIDARANIVNVSAAFAQPSTGGERALEATLNRALSRGVVIVVAAGNQGMVGSTVITRHPWVIPVVSYDSRGRPMTHSNLGRSIGRFGIGAPGEFVTSLGNSGQMAESGGTSVAAPFVTGTLALLRSEFPETSSHSLKLAILSQHGKRRTTVVPPLLDAWDAYQTLKGSGVSKWAIA